MSIAWQRIRPRTSGSPVAGIRAFASFSVRERLLAARTRKIAKKKIESYLYFP